MELLAHALDGRDPTGGTPELLLDAVLRGGVI
jgi:hypothetical protein